MKKNRKRDNLPVGRQGSRSYMVYRKHIRLKEFDYKSPNYYFVTICTRNRERLFVPRVSTKYGDLFFPNVAASLNNNNVAAGLVQNKIYNVAAASYAANHTSVFVKCLHDLENKYYDNLEVDFYCVMPDHVHIIFAFQDMVTKKSAIGSRSYSLGDIVRALKATTSRDIGKPIWQPNFYEHVIRNEKSLENIQKYILSNPLVEYDKIPWRKIDVST